VEEREKETKKSGSVFFCDHPTRFSAPSKKQMKLPTKDGCKKQEPGGCGTGNTKEKRQRTTVMGISYRSSKQSERVLDDMWDSLLP
jgi:hypothetical protein